MTVRHNDCLRSEQEDQKGQQKKARRVHSELKRTCPNSNLRRECFALEGPASLPRLHLDKHTALRDREKLTASSQIVTGISRGSSPFPRYLQAAQNWTRCRQERHLCRAAGHKLSLQSQDNLDAMHSCMLSAPRSASCCASIFHVKHD